MHKQCQTLKKPAGKELRIVTIQCFYIKNQDISFGQKSESIIAKSATLVRIYLKKVHNRYIS